MSEGKELAASEQLDGKTLLALITSGDMGGLDSEKKIAYYKSRCEAAGLDPRTAPFQFIRLQGKETLYATKGATDQLTKVHKISVEVLDQKTEGDIRVVMVRAKAADGRQTDEMGAVPVSGLKGADLANAYMKAITKAKRRAVLSLCGLGMMDETELEAVPNVVPAPVVRMPEPISPAEPELVEPLPPETEGVTVPETATEKDTLKKVVITPVKIIPEKNPNGGFIYNVYDSAGGLYVAKTKVDAQLIKEAVDKKYNVGLIVDANVIVKVDVPF